MTLEKWKTEVNRGFLRAIVALAFASVLVVAIRAARATEYSVLSAVDDVSALIFILLGVLSSAGYVNHMTKKIKMDSK